MYEIRFSEGVDQDLVKIKAYDRVRLLDAIEKQLPHLPNKETKNRKILMSLIPPFEAVPPIWELRVGQYRIFYDVDEKEKKVFVRAIRKKLPHKTTEEIL